MPDSALTHLHSRRRLRQVLTERPLVVRDRRPFQFVAFVQEGQPEGQPHILSEDDRFLGLGHYRARTHHRRDVAVDEGVAGHVVDADHGGDLAAAVGVLPLRDLGGDDLGLDVVVEVTMFSGPSDPD